MATIVPGTWSDYSALPAALQLQARAAHPEFNAVDLADLMFYVTQKGHVARRMHRLTDAAIERMTAALRGADVRSKADLHGWTGSPRFSLDRSPPMRVKK